MNEVSVLFLMFGAIIVVTSSIIKDKKFSTGICTSKDCERAAQKIQEYIDPSVNPCDNFYKFACGGFIRSHAIPFDKPGITPYTLINDILQDRLKVLFEEESQSNTFKPFLSLKRFYKSCMNKKSIEDNGLKTITSLLKQLGGWPVLEGKSWSEDGFDWKNITWNLRNLGMFHSGFIEFGVDNHLKNATLGIIAVDQATLGLYQEVLTQGLNNSVVQAYYKLMTNIAVIFGADKTFAEKEMLDALNLEASIAKICVPSEKLRDITLLFNPTTLNGMQKTYPSIPWIEYANKMIHIDGQTISGNEKVNVQQPKFITDLVNLLKQTPKRAQANYAIWRAVKNATPYLTEQVLQEFLEFEKQRIGVKQRKERWEECVAVMSDKLPILVGAMYVRKHFTPEAREKVEEIVHSIKKVFTQILKDVDWMDEKTKAHALQKVKKMITYVGYSDELLNDEILGDYYSSLVINSDNFLELGLNVTLFRLQKANERLREIIPRSNWKTRSTPAIINAFYSLTDNSIEFPAGILQDVYFDVKRPRYINFGAIGFLIGHEITHGFDDQGRQFDEHGNLIDWWDKETSEAFVKKTQCIIDQYNNYTVPEIGQNINGVSSQGENIADNGGVKEAYLAYHDWAERHPPEPVLPGLNYTANQLFWISAANVWCSNYNPEYLKLLVLTNAHCPDEFRVIGTFQNIEYFAKDFECPVGSQMHPAKKCTVW